MVRIDEGSLGIRDDSSTVSSTQIKVASVFLSPFFEPISELFVRLDVLYPKLIAYKPYDL